jgi:OFA family oxalate/formate antiporter-like MFS transporter
MAGLGINLALGILYTWSIFKQAIKESVLAQRRGVQLGYRLT